MLKLPQYLRELGVQSVYFCAGARNASLLGILDSFEIKHRFDERSAGFEALGETKLTSAPVVICTTSGTAVSECLPSMIESFYSEQKLIVLSADRPERLRNSHAPQAINQIDIFKNATRFFYSGLLLDFKKGSDQFPMHINIEVDDSEVERGKVSPIEAVCNIHQLETMSVCVLISEGHGLSEADLQYLHSTNAHFYVEALANLGGTKFENEINFEKDLLENYKNNVYDGILKIGMTPVTKLWRVLEQTPNKTRVFSSKSRTTGLSYGELIPFELLKSNFKSIDSPIALDSTSLQELEDILFKYKKSEPNIILKILASLPENTIVYVGNSMPIRYVEMLKLRHLHYYASRGANGIDGQISTAIGIARNTSEDVHAILGDLTFLYDANNILYNLPDNLIIHIVDNSGGRIFERVQVPKELVHEHSIDFQKIISGLCLEDKIKLHIVNNSETHSFWNAWQGIEK